MGKIYYTTKRDEQAGDKVSSGQHDSTLGDRTKSAKTFRELVVYTADQVYPEYVVLYKRLYQGAVAKKVDKFFMELPVYWTNCHRDPRNDPFAVHYEVDDATRNFLEQVAQKCSISGGAGGKLRVISATRIESSTIWNKYVSTRAELETKLQSKSQRAFQTPAELSPGSSEEGRVLTKKALKELPISTAATAVSTEHLNEALNELILWHGTKLDAAANIACDGLRIATGMALHGKRFGQGAYLAEDIDKSLSYADVDEEDGRQYILLCRALCGEMHYVDDRTNSDATDLAAKYGKNAVLANPEGEGPREFIILTESQVYPEYLLEIMVE